MSIVNDLDIAPQHQLAPEASQKVKAQAATTGAVTGTAKAYNLAQAANGDWFGYFDIYVYQSPEKYNGLATAASVEDPGDQPYFAYTDRIKGNIVTVRAWWGKKPSKPNAVFIVTINPS
jgi:hypothetical protein